MPPLPIIVFGGVVLVLAVVLGVSLSQQEGSVGAPVRQRRTALQIARIALAPATRGLLVRLESLAEAQPELAEAPAREELRELLMRSFVFGEALPAEVSLGADVRQALDDFLRLVASAVGEDGLGTPEDRLEAFRDPELRTPTGSGVWTWFPFED